MTNDFSGRGVELAPIGVSNQEEIVSEEDEAANPKSKKKFSFSHLRQRLSGNYENVAAAAVNVATNA